MILWIHRQIGREDVSHHSAEISYIAFFNLPRPATATAAATATLRNASDLRNCTSYFGACMWVWYCRPPIGAHFHPTPQPPPVPQQLGEKAHLRIAWSVAAVLANATASVQ